MLILIRSMKSILIITLAVFIFNFSYSQDDHLKKIIFIPHPRSEDQTNQSVLKGIEQIDFTEYDMTLLGGDLTYYTSIDRTSMDYCDSIFDLGSENTLWTMGNHDGQHPDLVAEYTHRPRFYSYHKDKITFLVLDVEAGSNGFTSSHVTDDQVTMIQNVADTISHSKYLILLHGRLLWMIGNPYFDSKLDSVAESTKQLDTSNFNTVVFPILQQVKNKGIQVLCLGGDKSKINIQYSPEDSITYIASTMAPEFSDELNDVVIFTHNLSTDTLTWKFVPLSKVDKKPVISELNNPCELPEKNIVTIRSDYENLIINIRINRELKSKLDIKIYDISGKCVHSEFLNPGDNSKNLTINHRGLYIVKIESENYHYSQKVGF
jgi:hypothetical protein